MVIDSVLFFIYHNNLSPDSFYTYKGFLYFNNLVISLLYDMIVYMDNQFYNFIITVF